MRNFIIDDERMKVLGLKVILAPITIAKKSHFLNI